MMPLSSECFSFSRASCISLTSFTLSVVSLFALACSTNCLANSLFEWLIIATSKLVVWLLKTAPNTKRNISGNKKVKNSDVPSRIKRFSRARTCPYTPIQYDLTRIIYSRMALPVKSINTSSKLAGSTVCCLVKPRASSCSIRCCSVSMVIILPASIIARRSHSSSASSI